MKIIVAVLVSTFFIGDAYAQSPAPSVGAPPSPNASTPAMRKSDANHDMKVDRHIRDLHAKLKITRSEETQWAAVAKAMRDGASELDKAIDKREAIIDNATAIDDLNAYGNITQAHADAVKNLSAVFSPLYSSMSADQKKVADKVFAQRADGAKNLRKAMQ